LLELAALGVRVDDTDRAGPALVEDHAAHVAPGTQLEAPGLAEERQDRGLRRRLRPHLATQALAEPAVDAGGERPAVAVRVGARHVGGRRRERRMPAGLRRLREQRPRERRLHRRVRVLARARALEGVAPGLPDADEVAGLAAHAVDALEAVVERL